MATGSRSRVLSKPEDIHGPPRAQVDALPLQVGSANDYPLPTETTLCRSRSRLARISAAFPPLDLPLSSGPL